MRSCMRIFVHVREHVRVVGGTWVRVTSYEGGLRSVFGILGLNIKSMPQQTRGLWARRCDDIVVRSRRSPNLPKRARASD